MLNVRRTQYDNLDTHFHSAMHGAASQENMMNTKTQKNRDVEL